MNDRHIWCSSDDLRDSQSFDTTNWNISDTIDSRRCLRRQLELGRAGVDAESRLSAAVGDGYDGDVVSFVADADRT